MIQLNQPKSWIYQIKKDFPKKLFHNYWRPWFNPMGTIDTLRIQIHTQSSLLNCLGHIYRRTVVRISCDTVALFSDGCLVCVSKHWWENIFWIYIKFNLCVHFHNKCSQLNKLQRICLFTTSHCKKRNLPFTMMQAFSLCEEAGIQFWNHCKFLHCLQHKADIRH